MLIIRGVVEDVELSGTLYEPSDDIPSFKGAPNEDASFVWICDEMYEVVSGGLVQRIGDREVNFAFEKPMPRGFESRETAIELAKEHILTQFARIGVDIEDVKIIVEE